MRMRRRGRMRRKIRRRRRRRASARLFNSPHAVVREELIPLNSGGERVKRLKKTKQQCIARRKDGGLEEGKEGEAEVGGWVARACPKGRPLAVTCGLL